MIMAEQKTKLHKIWILLFVLFSIAMMIAMPIGRAPDEYSHFLQAYIIADGQWLSSMTSRTVSYPEDIQYFDYQSITLEEVDDLLKTDFSNKRVSMPLGVNTAIYPPISYFPQALGILLASLFTKNGLIIAYCARAMNWFCTFAVLYWALQKLPRYKNVMIFLTLLPINLQEMVSVSADGMTTAVIFALTAFVLDSINRRKLFHKRDYFTIVLLSVAAVCWKVMYFPALFLLLLIPAECFPTKRHKKSW